MKLHLPDVTLYALDTANISLTLPVIERCREFCDFGDTLFIASRKIDAPYRTMQIGSFASDAESGKFNIQTLPSLIKTSHILFVQYDGFITDPAAWRDEFLEYDFIGAKWAWYNDGLNVGNTGFSLFSKKLLDVWGLPEVNPGLDSSDTHLARTLRPYLEKNHGIRFAPEAIADLFSYENSLPRQPTFGFHGLFNLWRHVSDADMEYFAREIAEYTLRGPGFAKMTAQYYMMRKFSPFCALYKRLREKGTQEEICTYLAKIYNELFAKELVAVGENLVKNPPPYPIPPITLAPGTDIKQDNEAIDPRGRLFPWER